MKHKYSSHLAATSSYSLIHAPFSHVARVGSAINFTGIWILEPLEVGVPLIEGTRLVASGLCRDARVSWRIRPPIGSNGRCQFISAYTRALCLLNIGH